MRFAGSAPVTDFLSKSVDMGSVAQKAAENRSQLKNAGTQLQGQVGATGISAAGEAEAAKIVGAAGVALANAQGNASMMSTIGQIGGAAIGQIPTGGSKTVDYDWNNIDTSTSYSGYGTGSFMDTSSFFKR